MINKINELTNGKVDTVYSEQNSIHIADYTEKTQSARNIELHPAKPADIDTLEIKNDNKLQIAACIFGKQSLTDENDKEIKHCECVLFPTFPTINHWILFVEIKDCKPGNISQYFNHAKEQIIETVSFFRKKNIIPENKKVHAVISFPRRNKMSFYNQLIQTGERKHFFDAYKIMIKGTNTLEARSHTQII